MEVKGALAAHPIYQAKCLMLVSSAPLRAPGQAMELEVPVQFPLSTSAWKSGTPHRASRIAGQATQGHHRYSTFRVDAKQGDDLARAPLSLLPNRIRPVVGRQQRGPLDCNVKAISKTTSSDTSSPRSTYSPPSHAGMNGSSGHYPFVGDVNNNLVREPRMQVSSLLVDPHARTYHLEVIQHPLRTAEFGSANALSRLPLTPPIVVQLTVRDGSGNCVFPETEIPFLIAHLSLFSGDGSVALDVNASPGGTVRRQLYGNLVAEPQKLRDPSGKNCLLFIFSDVSVRWRGQYQLGIALMRLSSVDPSGVMSVTGNGAAIASTRTKPFEVVSHRDYIAAPVTGLTQCLARQGVRMYPSIS